MNHRVGHLEKSGDTCFFSKLYEIFAILSKNACTYPQLTFLTNSIGIICIVTCISHVPYKNDDCGFIFTSPTDKTILSSYGQLLHPKNVKTLAEVGGLQLSCGDLIMHIYLTVRKCVLHSLPGFTIYGVGKPKIQSEGCCVLESTSVVINYWVWGGRRWPG